MPQPLRITADVRRVDVALRNHLSVLESQTIDRVRLAQTWDAFRSTFGEGPPPEGVSVDGIGLPDGFGLRALVRESSALTDETKDVLYDFLDGQNACHCSLVTGRDDGSVRKQKQTIRNALALLNSTAAETPSPPPRQSARPTATAT